MYIYRYIYITHTCIMYIYIYIEIITFPTLFFPTDSKVPFFIVHVAAFHALISQHEFIDVYFDMMEHQHASQIGVGAGALNGR